MSKDLQRKAILFRYYPGDLNDDFKVLMGLQYHTTKFNKALTDAVRIASAYMRKVEKRVPIEDRGLGRSIINQRKNAVENDLDISIGW